MIPLHLLARWFLDMNVLRISMFNSKINIILRNKQIKEKTI